MTTTETYTSMRVSGRAKRDKKKKDDNRDNYSASPTLLSGKGEGEENNINNLRGYQLYAALRGEEEAGGARRDTVEHGERSLEVQEFRGLEV